MDRRIASWYAERTFQCTNPQQVKACLDLLESHDFVNPHSVKHDQNKHLIHYKLDVPRSDIQAADLAVRQDLEAITSVHGSYMPELEVASGPSAVAKAIRLLAARIEQSPRPSRSLVASELRKIVRSIV